MCLESARRHPLSTSFERKFSENEETDPESPSVLTPVFSLALRKLAMEFTD